MPRLLDFGQTAQSLARNPLGIIALFIVLVYGIAALVLGVSSAHLEFKERILLVLFLVLFPVLVLGVFYRLVVFHHVKLYGPSDYPEPDGFLRSLTPHEQRQKLEEDLKELKTPADNGTPKTGQLPQGSDERDKGSRITARDALLAEELALREIEVEFTTRIQRQVAVAPDIFVDGLFRIGQKSVAIEVKLATPLRLQRVATRALDRLHNIAETAPSISFLIAIVVDGRMPPGETARFVSSLDARKLISMRASLRIFDFAELREKYGVDDIGRRSPD